MAGPTNFEIMTVLSELQVKTVRPWIARPSTPPKCTFSQKTSSFFSRSKRNRWPIWLPIASSEPPCVIADYLLECEVRQREELVEERKVDLGE